MVRVHRGGHSALATRRVRTALSLGDRRARLSELGTTEWKQAGTAGSSPTDPLSTDHLYQAQSHAAVRSLGFMRPTEQLDGHLPG